MRHLLILLLGVAPSGFAADKPLAEAAKPLAAALKAGCIVTGERIGGQVSFAVAGSLPEAAGTACEHVTFEIGSITKVFTGLLLAQAVVEGKVKLQTPIRELLGGQQSFADPRIGAITLLQLATHTSGLPRLPSNFAAGSFNGDPYARYDEALLRAYLATAELKGAGPFSCSYSNLGFGLLGHLLGEVYRIPWKEAVETKICRPLGLHETKAGRGDSTRPLASPFSGEKKAKAWTFDAIAGAGALHSTAADLMKFGDAMAAPLETPIAEAFRLALAPHAQAPSGGQVGLGIFMRQIDGSPSYHHDGGTGGYRSGLQVIPSRHVVRVVLINNDSLAGSAVIGTTRPAKDTPATGQQEISLSPEALKPYAGVYVVDNDSRFTVLMSNDHLWVRLTGQPFLRVFASGPSRFFYKDVAAEIEFHRDHGAIKSLTLFQNGNELTAQRTPDSPPTIKLRPAIELQPYAGTYALMGMKDLDITINGSTLFAQLAGQPAMPVFETAPDRFEFDVVEAALVFTRDEQKRVNGVTLLQNGMLLPAPKKAN